MEITTKEIAAVFEKTPRFILNEKDCPQDLWRDLCKLIKHPRFIDAAEKGLIVLWPTLSVRKKQINFFPIGCGAPTTPIPLPIDKGWPILSELTATKDLGRTIIKNIQIKKEIEKVDLPFGFNILDI